MQLYFTSDGVLDTHKQSNLIFNQAIEEVAELLGYEDPDKYNDACLDNEEEVKERIRAL